MMLIRADASPEVGWGHAMRSVALTQAWIDRGGRAVVAAVSLPPPLEAGLRNEGAEVVFLPDTGKPADDAVSLLNTARELANVAWMVVDGYGFGYEYHEVIKQAGYRLMVVDDHGAARRYVADVVLDQNLLAEEVDYSDRLPSTRLLLGTKYALVRREFLQWRRRERSGDRAARRALVTLGGGRSSLPVLDLALTTLANLEVLPGLDVVAMAGTSIESISPNVDTGRRLRRRVEHGIDDVAEIMAGSDIAIASGGSVVWELCCLGIPSLLIPLVANQIPVAERMAQSGLAINLGPAASLTPERLTSEFVGLANDTERRADLATRCGALVDGLGAARVVSELKRALVRLRRATVDDRHLLWLWANDPEVRAASFSSPSISWAEHLEWFAQQMRDDRCLILLATEETGEPLGQVRFECREHGAEMSVSLDHSQRGKGWGRAVIDGGVAMLLRETDVDTVHALIKPENVGSIRSFEDAGFKATGLEHRNGMPALRYLLRGDEWRGTAAPTPQRAQAGSRNASRASGVTVK